MCGLKHTEKGCKKTVHGAQWDSLWEPKESGELAPTVETSYRDEGLHKPQGNWGQRHMVWPQVHTPLAKLKTTSVSRQKTDPGEKQEPCHRNSKLLFRTQSQNPKILKSVLGERKQAGNSEFSAPSKLFYKNEDSLPSKFNLRLNMACDSLKVGVTDRHW